MTGAVVFTRCMVPGCDRGQAEGRRTSMLPSQSRFGLARNMQIANSGSAPPTGKKKEVPELEPTMMGCMRTSEGHILLE